MIVYVEEDEFYPDYTLYLDPVHHSTKVDAPEALVDRYVAARKAYLASHRELRELVDAGEDIGLVHGLSGHVRKLT